MHLAQPSLTFVRLHTVCRKTHERSFVKVNFDIDSNGLGDEKKLESVLRSGIISGQLNNFYVQPASLTFRPVVGPAPPTEEPCELRCNSGDLCILLADRCNGVEDCPDASDEDNCDIGSLSFTIPYHLAANANKLSLST